MVTRGGGRRFKGRNKRPNQWAETQKKQPKSNCHGLRAKRVGKKIKSIEFEMLIHANEIVHPKRARYYSFHCTRMHTSIQLTDEQKPVSGWCMHQGWCSPVAAAVVLFGRVFFFGLCSPFPRLAVFDQSLMEHRLNSVSGMHWSRYVLVIPCLSWNHEDVPVESLKNVLNIFISLANSRNPFRNMHEPTLPYTS